MVTFPVRVARFGGNSTALQQVADNLHLYWKKPTIFAVVEITMA